VLAIIAHDGKKIELVTWAASNKERLRRFKLVATATTGQLLREKVGLEVETMLSGPRGGDVQIASRIVQGEIDAVFFFQDPLDAHPHDPDIQAVMRVCNVHDVPIAPNRATADIIIGTRGFNRPQRQLEAERAQRALASSRGRSRSAGIGAPNR